MSNLLQINTSIFAGNGQSTGLANQFVGAWSQANPDATVTVRDLSDGAIPHLDGQRFGAFLAKPEERTVEQQEVVAFSDALIDELRRADIIVLGLPMYNFGLPSTLKAYFDHVGRAGVTFRYTDKGAEGLITGKKVFVFATRGGIYEGTPVDTQTAYVRDFLRFLGLSDVEFVYAEGLALGDASKQASLAKAQASVLQLVSPLRAAA
jgi:FMN-dependent NADH-azoreductase